MHPFDRRKHKADRAVLDGSVVVARAQVGRTRVHADRWRHARRGWRWSCRIALNHARIGVVVAVVKIERPALAWSDRAPKRIITIVGQIIDGCDVVALFQNIHCASKGKPVSRFICRPDDVVLKLTRADASIGSVSVHGFDIEVDPPLRRGTKRGPKEPPILMNRNKVAARFADQAGAIAEADRQAGPGSRIPGDTKVLALVFWLRN